MAREVGTGEGSQPKDSGRPSGYRASGVKAPANPVLQAWGSGPGTQGMTPRAPTRPVFGLGGWGLVTASSPSRRVPSPGSKVPHTEQAPPHTPATRPSSLTLCQPHGAVWRKYTHTPVDTTVLQGPQHGNDRGPWGCLGGVSRGRGLLPQSHLGPKVTQRREARTLPCQRGLKQTLALRPQMVKQTHSSSYFLKRGPLGCHGEPAKEK